MTGFKEPKINVVTCTSGARTFLTNAFLVELPNGVVAIDAMMTVSDAHQVRDRLDTLRKPLLAVLITHGHPDHYNGVGELIRGFDDVPVIATRGVDEAMHRIDDAKAVQWQSVFGDDWPARRTFPNRFVRDGDVLDFDGVPFEVREFGPGESHWDLVWTVGCQRRVAFVGDMVFNGVHSFMNDGHTADWLRSLDALERLSGDIALFYTGHGPAGEPLAMIAAQRAYIGCYRAAVARLANGNRSLDDAGKDELETVMKRFLPTADLDVFIKAGADAIAAELASQVSDNVIPAGPQAHFDAR
ncbi:MBL fold metallo-hydrolase [Burkholderia lata]|uniref:MBL fold metallo-hydrolase n=1 Tax=Burkholderia lata (strain ATCC 17760 / DSM 23089 / LMG 22485 / NCIMB 9086 / R18194 / 383) TaxID=482957 RepID=UPI001453A8A6|nr:MBL fold metallo-hydrolase [Burkholderia lata]VWC78170.1 MBL fold metallo-hydrolase [Burkholderia lata]